MSIKTNRIIFEDDTTLNDLSVNLNNFQSGTEVIEIVAADDYLYLAAPWAFNHRHFEVATANSNTSAASVEIYTGSEWESAVDVFDQTSVSGASFAQSGIISWSPDLDQSWRRVKTSEDIAEVSSLRIFDSYWARIKWDADFSASTALSFVGWKFANDQDLGALYPELETSTAKTAFESGKTTWDEQHIEAARRIPEDLMNLNDDFYSADQILNWEKFRIPAMHQVAAIVYRALGDDWKDNFERALKEYSAALNQVIKHYDKNGDGKLSLHEQVGDMRIFRQ